MNCRQTDRQYHRTRELIRNLEIKESTHETKENGDLQKMTEGRVISNLSHSFLKLTRGKDSHVPVQKKKKNLIVTKFNGKYTNSFGEGGVERGRKEGVLDFDLTEKAKGSSLVVQWLRIHASTTGNLGSAPGWGPITCRAQPKKEKQTQDFLLPSQKESTCNAGHPGWIFWLEKSAREGIGYRFSGFPGDSAGKESICNSGDLGSTPGLGTSPEEGKSYPLQYSGLENSMDCIVHGVTKSWTQLSDFHFQPKSLEKAKATHSNTLPWRIPRTEEPGGLWSRGSQRVGHD